jgi:hypothetical protein
LLWLGTDKLKSKNNYTKKYFVGNNYFFIFVKILFMKISILILSFLFATATFAQKNGKIFYQNVDSVNKSKEEFRDLGLKIEFAPNKIDLQYFPKIQKVIFDYKEYFQKWYSQVYGVYFLDDESFSKLDKRNMSLKDIQYVQLKNEDYKWDGEKPFEIPHVLSKIYFTTFVTEYSDKFILQVKIAEELKK